MPNPQLKRGGLYEVRVAGRDDRQVDFVRLMAAETRRLYAYIRLLVMNDETDTEDVFQSTSMALWKKFEDYDSSRDFGAWARRMAFYEVLRQREKRRRIRLLSDEALAALADAAEPLSQHIEHRRDALSACLDRLSNEDRGTIHARYFEGVSTREIAERAGRSVDAIYRDLARIHGLLLRCIERNVT